MTVHGFFGVGFLVGVLLMLFFDYLKKKQEVKDGTY